MVLVKLRYQKVILIAALLAFGIVLSPISVQSRADGACRFLTRSPHLRHWGSRHGWKFFGS